MSPNFPSSGFPATRLRRMRTAPWSRALVRETALGPGDMIWAIVLVDGENKKEPVAAMPGVERLSIDQAVNAAKKARDLGIPALALFPFTSPDERSADARLALNGDNLMCRAASTIKDAVPEIGLMADVALDPYTDHGHDGVMHEGEILNDETVELLVMQSLLQARAGFDIIAPSDMMDGRIGAIRANLENEGMSHVQIMSYAAKYASAFYGPYREAIGSSGVLKGDKRTYQMDPGNSEEALREAKLDLTEGADSIMVKPAGAYLDIIYRLREAYAAPTYAFQVSGEYAMISAAAANGWIDRDRAILESLTAIKRAGANGVITYFAAEACALLEGQPAYGA
ncbi:MAG: porphobilinogen synthase [Pseudomonadota bacterium]